MIPLTLESPVTVDRPRLWLRLVGPRCVLERFADKRALAARPRDKVAAT